MSATISILLGLVGLVFLCCGADLLVKGGVRIAEALRIPSVIIGLTLVSSATSAPELVVSIQAALGGAGDISLGNVVGSNICNIGLILGLAAVITPMKVNRGMLFFDTPVMILTSIVLLLFVAASHGMTRWQAAVLLLGFAVYLGKQLRDALKERAGSASPAVSPCPAGESPAARRPMPLWGAVLLVLVGLAGLVVGAKFFVNGAIVVAKLCHVSDAVIGLTIVAVGTSLPELATSAVAAIRGEDDIAVGNVVGSNIFNILCILGIAPLISPFQAAGIQSVDLIAMVAFAAALMVMSYTGRSIRRWEGAALLTGYAGYVAYLCMQ